MTVLQAHRRPRRGRVTVKGALEVAAGGRPVTWECPGFLHTRYYRASNMPCGRQPKKKLIRRQFTPLMNPMMHDGQRHALLALEFIDTLSRRAKQPLYWSMV